MNIKRFLLSSVVGFIFMAIYEMLVHNIALIGVYDLTPQLWRTPEEMNIALMMAGYALMTLLLVCLFAKQMNVRTAKQGAAAGLAVGLPLALAGAMSYVWMPISITLAACWFVATLVKVLIIGVITGSLYRDF